ncbi:hypothetical protein M407DRAFT_245296 [Tulasnella calospora MUT 4182]|uniref:Uncharacterized protein n=1 Tax=Tulasnella calospora MUT 4182 TaxID=1051891 RepID=A0A0C3KKT7_9AGAM|nr:hypothetical protein M407DRAFT_245296 [Tulasnella calospora MUT 4182]
MMDEQSFRLGSDDRSILDHRRMFWVRKLKPSPVQPFEAGAPSAARRVRGESCELNTSGGDSAVTRHRIFYDSAKCPVQWILNMICR